MRVIRPGRLEQGGDLCLAKCPQCGAEVELRVDEFVPAATGNPFLDGMLCRPCPTAGCDHLLWQQNATPIEVPARP